MKCGLCVVVSCCRLSRGGISDESTTGTVTALNGDMEKTDILEEICWGWARVDEQTTKYTMKCSVVIKDLGVCVCARQ